MPAHQGESCPPDQHPHPAKPVSKLADMTEDVHVHVHVYVHVMKGALEQNELVTSCPDMHTSCERKVADVHGCKWSK